MSYPLQKCNCLSQVTADFQCSVNQPLSSYLYAQMQYWQVDVLELKLFSKCYNLPLPDFNVNLVYKIEKVSVA